MAENLTEEEKIRIENTLKQLKASFDMYEKTKKETEQKMKEKLNADGTRRYTESDIKKQLALIEGAQNDIVLKYEANGGNPDDLKKKKRTQKKSESPSNSINRAALEMMQTMEAEREEKKAKIAAAEAETNKRLEQDYIPAKGDYNPEESFDIIPLPSKGEGYKDKIAKAAVAFLTAYDENMIISPNLYRDNLILDYLLQEKLLSKEIDPMDLLEGDRDAIILFLRTNGYGPEYPITATDEATGKEFDAVVDLSKLNYKEFNLKGDSNGWFPFTLPVSKKEVKFRFPTHRDNVTLKKMQDAEDYKIRKSTVKNYVETMDTFIESDKEISKEDKVKVRQAIRTIEGWSDKMEDENPLKYNHTLTNRLNMLVMAVDGITDRKYIYDFIRRMNVRDSSALRKYMADNEPGIDYNITVDRPESLGGGSFTTFLQLDQFIFLNLA